MKKRLSPEVIADFRNLKMEAQALIDRRRDSARPYIEIGVITLLVGMAIYLRPQWPLIALGLATLGSVSAVWWIHDAGHDSLFKSKRQSRGLIEFFGILILGMPQIEYHYEVHRRHHGSTNVIGKDGALDTGPVRWHRSMFDRPPKYSRTWQVLVWHLLVMPFAIPLITQRGLRTLAERRSYGRLAFFAVRWALAIYLLNFDWVFILVPGLIAGFTFSFFASLNHFHLRISRAEIAPYPLNVFLTAQNLSGRSRFHTWLSGGLNFHVEHHLFPNLASYDLWKISPSVEAFAKRHKFPYNIASVAQTSSELRATLADPYSRGIS